MRIMRGTCEVDATHLDYAELRESLARSSFGLAPSELHGNICGIICSGGEPAAQRWVEECVSEHAAHDPQASRELREALSAIVAVTSPQLGSTEFDFEPLLPDENAALDEQVQALAAYCHGFLAGLVLGSAEAARAAAGDLGEILGDFAEISRAGLADDEEDLDQADFALAELKEYVRVSVQLAFEELDARRRTAPAAGTTH
jgi:hypothetical protein